MNRRTRVISATALLIVGAFLFLVPVFGPDLQAASIEGTGFDLAKFFIWGGVVALGISSLLFISAGAE